MSQPKTLTLGVINAGGNVSDTINTLNTGLVAMGARAELEGEDLANATDIVIDLASSIQIEVNKLVKFLETQIPGATMVQDNVYEPTVTDAHTYMLHFKINLYNSTPVTPDDSTIGEGDPTEEATTNGEN